MNARIVNTVTRLADLLGSVADAFMWLESRVRGFAASLAEQLAKEGAP